MRVVQDYPPLIAEIDAAFKVRGKTIFYAWGDRIYNPMGATVPAAILAHEQVHGRRQLCECAGGSPEGETAIAAWWHRYIDDPAFRLAEEIPAHVAEFGALCAEAARAARWRSRRAMRRVIAADVARKLASPLYGNLISFAKAKALLLEASA